jgi:hypothetical protein
MVIHRSFRLTSASDGSAERPSALDAKTHSQAIVFAVAQQAILLFFAATILDGGQILRLCTLAAIVSWVPSLLIMLRRPKEPTHADLGIIKYGFWPALLIVFVVASLLNAIAF